MKRVLKGMEVGKRGTGTANSSKEKVEIGIK